MSGDVRGQADAVIAEARRWVGTPYRHQGRRRGVGCDCLGLVIGVWEAVYGTVPEEPGAYAPDWAEAGARESLLDAATRHCRAKNPQKMVPGDLILFRWRPEMPAKHAGILVDQDHFVHAYEGIEVTVSAMVPQWRRRIAAVFAFPERASEVPGVRSG